jgi:CHAT domain-containing protein
MKEPMRWQYAAAGGVLAAFGISTIVAFDASRGDAAELHAAVRALHYRPVEGRLSGFPYAAPPSSKGRVSSEAALAEVNLRNIALRAAASRRSSPFSHAGYVAVLLAGETAAAKRRIETALEGNDASAAMWSDYAAVVYAAAAPDDALQLVTALAATERALDLDPKLPEALFNRALLLEALFLRSQAIMAYTTYLAVEPSSRWSDEARTRRQNLDAARARASIVRDDRSDLERAASSRDELFVNDMAVAFPAKSQAYAEGYFLEEWAKAVLANDGEGAATQLWLCRTIGRSLEKHRGESLLADAVRTIDAAGDPRMLAQAHRAYGEGQRRFFRRHNREARKALEDALSLFESYVSPMALHTRHILALIELSEDKKDHGIAALNELVQRAPDRYRTLRGELAVSRGRSAAVTGSPDDALALYGEATATFAALGDEDTTAQLRDATAALLTRFGETVEAWPLRHAALTSAADEENEWHLAETVYSMAVDAIAEKRWDVAYALLKVVTEMPASREDRLEEAMSWSGVIAKRAQLNRAAATHLAAARARELPELSVVEALSADDRRETIKWLTDALNIVHVSGHAISARVQLLVERGQAFRATGQTVLALRDLEEAVALADRDRAIPPTIRASVLTKPAEAYCMLADLIDLQGETQYAIEILDRARTSRSSATAHFSHLFGRPPPNTVLITYGIYADRLVIYTMSDRGRTRTQVALGASRLDQLVSAFETALQSGSRATVEKTGRELSRVLIAPIAQTLAAGDSLVFASDAALRRIPFTALQQDNARYLIEDHPIVVTPTLNGFLLSTHKRWPTSRALLSVGNPLLDERFSLSSLAGAEAEAREIAAMYPSRAMLLGADATKQRVSSALEYCDAAHFAVHANTGLADAVPPHLLLSSEKSDDGKLTVADIAKLRLDGVRTVVLAGCRTALPSPRQSSTRSLVSAFLDAGAGSVIGTLWEIDDTATQRMSVAFHRRLREGATPAEALRSVQVHMIRSNAPLSDWASLQLYGSGL